MVTTELQRLWREDGLRVTVGRRRKRTGTSTAPERFADAPNTVWAIDFHYDVTDDGRPIRSRRSLMNTPVNASAIRDWCHVECAYCGGVLP